MVLLYGKLERADLVTSSMDQEVFKETISNTIAPHERLKGKRFHVQQEGEPCHVS